MNIYTPFTYIIGWSKHKKFYYGSKYADGCQPSDLWTTYFTSSYYVDEFRKEFGEPDIIKIHRTFSDGKICALFEHQFLIKIDAKNHPNFLNENNSSKFFGPISEKSKEKRIKTWIKKYEVDHPMKCLSIANKQRDSFFETYGVYNPSQVPEIQQKKIQTCLRKYNTTHHSKHPDYIKKFKKTSLERYGVDNPSKSDIIIKRIQQTNLEKYNVEWSWQAEEVKTKIRNTWLENHGVDNPSKIIKICKYCNQLKNIQHESKCKDNSDRNIWDRSGSKNGRAKTFKFTNTDTGEEYIIKGGFKKFCKEMKISTKKLNRDSYNWKSNKLD